MTNLSEKEFTQWFITNYPENTLIHDPLWHAPKIFRRAQQTTGSAPEAYIRTDDLKLIGTYSKQCQVILYHEGSKNRTALYAAPASPAASVLTDEYIAKKWREYAHEGLTDNVLKFVHALLAASTDMKPAGVASAMPGVAEWTVTVCKAEDVPIGTQLYVR